MRFGIEFGSYPSDLPPVEVCQQVTERALAAQRNNFDALFVAQHFLTGPDAAILHSIPLLSYLAGRVPDMYVGTSIFLLPLHHPVMVAEYMATLDNLSGGKLLFGVGQGYRESEFKSFGIDLNERRGRLVESLDVIRRLWSEDSVTFHGKFFSSRQCIDVAQAAAAARSADLARRRFSEDRRQSTGGGGPLDRQPAPLEEFLARSAAGLQDSPGEAGAAV